MDWKDDFTREDVEHWWEELAPGGIVVAGLHVPEHGLYGVRDMKWGVRAK
jgi:hypothetical protein